MASRTPNYVHLRDTEEPHKTVCDRIIWEAVRVTSNPGQVTCPDCIKENCGQSVGCIPVDASLAA
jgi:hypothetical protein